MTLRRAWALCLLAGLLACGEGAGGALDAGPLTDGGGECTPALALQTVTSSGGAYRVSVCSTAEPARGIDTFTLFVADATTGAAVPGLTVTVLPWMPVMGHGSVSTTVTELGQGLYAVANCVFTMGGIWQLRITLTQTPSDSATPQFTIS